MKASKKVQLLKQFDADKIAIEKDHYFPSAYIIDLPLDSTPDHVWHDCFEREWKLSRQLWDRKLFILGDRLRLVTSPNNIQEKLDWVKTIISETNRSIEQFNKAAARKAQLLKRTLEDEANIEMIRGVLRRIGT